MPSHIKNPTYCNACQKWISSLSTHIKTKIHNANVAAFKARYAELRASSVQIHPIEEPPHMVYEVNEVLLEDTI
jgi:hypothetical protein